jgi:ADP-L-glycero-D-manno-heptose 6-epimerase
MLEKIIITGTLGFIGSNLKKELESRFEIIQINEDIFQSVNWREEVSKFFWTDLKAVFHIGACSNTLESDVNYMMLVNYEFTKHLSNLCASKKVPLVYSSSAANYGTNGEYPSNLYGWSKYAAEDYVISKGGIGLRYFNVYGPGEENKGGMASVAYQMSVAHKEGKEIKLFPKKPRRDFVYVRDVISANIYAFEDHPLLKGKYYEVGSGEARPFEDVLDILKIPFTYHPEESIPKGYQFFTQSSQKKWMSGWSPGWNLERGLADYFTKDI